MFSCFGFGLFFCLLRAGLSAFFDLGLVAWRLVLVFDGFGCKFGFVDGTGVCLLWFSGGC